MRWNPPSDRAQFWLWSPVLIPLLIVGTPVILALVGVLKLMEMLLPETEWRPWFAWRPVEHYRADQWIWLEAIERRRMWPAGKVIYRMAHEDQPHA